MPSADRFHPDVAVPRPAAGLGVHKADIYEGNHAALELGNNTAFRNRRVGFDLSDAAPVRAPTRRSATPPWNACRRVARADRNSWQLQGWSTETFRSTDAAEAEGPRTTAGRLPGTAFLSAGNGVGASMSGR